MNRLVLCFIVTLMIPTISIAQSEAPAWSRWLRDAPPTPPFEIPATLEQWKPRRAEIRAKLWELLGKLPPRPRKPAVKTVLTEDRGHYTLEKLLIDNGAGDQAPAYLLIPKNAPEKCPAVLYCHWHGGNYDIGKEELFKTHAVPEAPGPALTRLGFVVLAMDAPCFGERNGGGPGGPNEKGGAGEMTASKFNLWVGRTLWGMIVRDDLIGLDLLASHPRVDSGRIGVTGISMGATRTWWIMALDDRPRAGVAVCCMTRYRDLIATEGLKYHGIYYFVPGMLNHFDTEAVVALAAPRPLLLSSGERDSGSPVEGIKTIERVVSKAYGLYGESSRHNFKSDIYPGVAHVYTKEMWQKTQDWLLKHVAGGKE